MYLQINSYSNWKIGAYIDILVAKALFKKKLFSRMTTLPPVCCVSVRGQYYALCQSRTSLAPCNFVILFILNPDSAPTKPLDRLLLLLPILGVNSHLSGISTALSLIHIYHFLQEPTPTFSPSKNKTCFFFTFLSSHTF